MPKSDLQDLQNMYLVIQTKWNIGDRNTEWQNMATTCMHAGHSTVVVSYVSVRSTMCPIFRLVDRKRWDHRWPPRNPVFTMLHIFL